MNFTIPTVSLPLGPLGELPRGDINVGKSAMLALASQHADHWVSA